MGVLRRFFRRLAGLAGAAAIVIMGGVCYYQNEIPDSFYVTQRSEERRVGKECRY